MVVPVSAQASSILVIDDNEGIRVALEATLDAYEVTCLPSATSAVALLRDTSFDLVICDLLMPEMTGAELYQGLGLDSPMRDRFIFMTGGGLPSSVSSFLEAEAPILIRKPFDVEEVRETVEGVLRKLVDPPAI